VTDLLDARARLGHFLAHYNHFRPHQGLEGLTPADRFFGVESEVRRAMESAMAENEYRLAVEEEPRKPLFLVGQIGDQSIALRGERGRVVVEMPDGTTREIETRDLGTQRKEEAHGSDEQRRAGDAPGEDAAAAHGAQAHELSSAREDALGGAGTVAGGERGGEAAGAQVGGGDPSGVAGQDEPRGGGEGPRDAAASLLAALPAGGGGDGGGVPEAAALAAGAGSLPRADGERPEPFEEDRGARGGALGGSTADRDPQGDAGQPGEPERGDGPWGTPEAGGACRGK
jgi:hypothetical protein